MRPPALLAAGLLVAGLATSLPTAAATARPVTAAPTGVRPLADAPDRSGAWVADVIASSRARARPSASAPPRGMIGGVARWGTSTALLVLQARIGPERREWLRVALDRRPNGSSVWIDADDTVLHRDSWRIQVSLARRRVRVYRSGRRRRVFDAVVGKRSTPTPTGLFAIAAELRQPDPGEFEGSWVLPLTAHSTVLMHFEGGSGQVAMHGRGGPSLLDPLGSARSHGCVRLSNEAIAWIATHVPTGTPVRIG